MNGSRDIKSPDCSRSMWVLSPPQRDRLCLIHIVFSALLLLGIFAHFFTAGNCLNHPDNTIKFSLSLHLKSPREKKKNPAKMSLTNCRFYEDKYPEVDSFVMVNVKQVRVDQVILKLRVQNGRY